MERYKLEIAESAEDEFKSLPLQVRRRIARAIRRLAEEPRPPGAKKLKAIEGWRIRVGDYRVLYSIDERTRTVVVFKIGHRREVYR